MIKQILIAAIVVFMFSTINAKEQGWTEMQTSVVYHNRDVDVKEALRLSIAYLEDYPQCLSTIDDVLPSNMSREERRIIGIKEKDRRMKDLEQIKSVYRMIGNH